MFKNISVSFYFTDDSFDPQKLTARLTHLFAQRLISFVPDYKLRQAFDLGAVSQRDYVFIIF